MFEARAPVKRGDVERETDKSDWNCGGRRFRTLLSPTPCWEISSVLLNERIPEGFMASNATSSQLHQNFIRINLEPWSKRL